jgi:hypothetical protein
MGKKSCTAGHLTYINNHILLPKLQYINSTCCLSENMCKKLQSPVSTITKRKCNLPLTTSFDILYHEGFLGFKALYHFHTEANISELIKRLNSSQTDHDTTIIRLKQFQLLHLLTTPVFENLTCSLHNPPFSNFNYDCLMMAQSRDINIYIPPFIRDQFSIRGSGIPISVILQSMDNNQNKTLSKLIQTSL